MNNDLAKKIENLNLKKSLTHIFMCGGKSCNENSKNNADESWEQLKKLCADHSANHFVNRTRTTCLRLCSNGPIAVVYPSGSWYQNATGENLTSIFKSEVIDKKELESLLLFQNDLKQVVK